MVLQAHEQLSLAVTCYSTLRRLAPENFSWAYLLAIAASEAGQSGVASAALDQASRLNPTYMPIRLRQANSLLESGRVQAAAGEFQTAVRDSPQNPEAYYGLGRSLAAVGDLRGAVVALEQACDLFPPYASAHYAAAQLYRRLGEARRAADHLRLYEASASQSPISDDPVLGEVRRLYSGAQTHIARSKTLERLGRLAEAAAANVEALEADPSSVQAHINLISLYGRLGRHAEAESHFKAVNTIEPHNADAHYNYGVLLLHQGRTDLAAAEFRRVLDTNPKHADAHNNYGLLLETKGHLIDAANQYRAALESLPTHRGARYHLGMLFLRTGRARQAAEHFQQILEPDDDGSTDVCYALATAYAKLGDAGRAFIYTQRAYQLALKYSRRDLLNRLRHDIRALEPHSPR
jgi:tetratricopeptide (TPR) repeat protein